MSEAPRITAADLKRRMNAGENFTIIDTRNPQAWGESDVMAAGARRVPVDALDNSVSHIPRDKPVVAYCT
jgi:rhodanese-related sulfurtransferase